MIADLYYPLKIIHVTSVIISGSLFVLRGVWMLRDSAALNRRWVRVTPHINDTVLLLSAIFLAIDIQQYPFVQGWLTAKVIALAGYIVAGTIALKRGRSLKTRKIAFIISLFLFAYIVSVAFTRNVLPGYSF